MIDETTNDRLWFGAKTVYQWIATDRAKAPDQRVYEERVTLILARDLDAALEKGEALAKAYAEQHDGMVYLGFIDVYHMFEEVGDGAEVYSLVRSSELPPSSFLNHYYDDGSQHSQSAS